MKEFLAECEIINFSHPLVAKKAKELRGVDDEETAKNCFNFVLNEINHSGDICAKQGTITASEVLEFKTGWCYAKSHLLCALLRANKFRVHFVINDSHAVSMMMVSFVCMD